MNIRKLFLALAVALCVMNIALSVNAQDNNAQQAGNKPAEVDETNLDTQLYLIVGTNADVADPKLPIALDPIIKQLRTALPFKNYRLAATLVNRVKNEGRLDLSWVGGPLASAGSPAEAANGTLTPTFNSFNVRLVRLARGSDGQQMVQMQGFNFGARVPIQVAAAIAANGAVTPSINYERTGVSTDISMREGEPVVVGTLNIGPSGDAIILIVSAKRTNK